MSANVDIEIPTLRGISDRQLSDPLTPTEKALRKLPMDQISIDPVLQPRQSTADYHEASDRIVSDFVDLILDGGRLPAIHVAKFGGHWFVVDGHHRLEAAWQARGKALKIAKKKELHGGARRTPTQLIAVSVVQGSLQDLADLSVKKNKDPKLNMTKDDRMNEAWRRVVKGAHSDEEIQGITSISTRWLGFMRYGLRKLQTGQFRDHDFLSWSWAMARRIILDKDDSGNALFVEGGESEAKLLRQMREDELVERKTRQFKKTLGKVAKDTPWLATRIIRASDPPTSVIIGQGLLDLDHAAKRQLDEAKQIEVQVEKFQPLEIPKSMLEEG